MIRRFLYDQLYPDSWIPSSALSVSAYPQFNGKISIFYNATATFHAPSDISNVAGMRREYIRATPSWRNKTSRYDTAFINTNPDLEGMRGLEVARILTFFSFVHERKTYPCALIHWFSRVGTGPDENTGLWTVEPDLDGNGKPHVTIIHIETIFRATHLLPVYRTARYIRRSLKMDETLDSFREFYVNKFIDYHAFWIAS